MKTFISSLILLSSLNVVASEPPASFTYQGKIYRSNGFDPLTSSSVIFKVQLRSPDGACVLFEETHQRDMSNSDGNFSLLIGDGTNTGASALSIMDAFDNSSVKTGASNCVYTPATGDARRLRFSYDDGTETVTLPTDQTIRSVPYALHSRTLGGLTKNKFIQVSSSTTQAKIDQLTSMTTDLNAIVSGTSSLYAKSTDLPFSGGVLNLSSTGVKVPDSPISNDAAVNKNYTDSVMGGKSLDLTGLVNGQSLVWNSIQNKWMAQTPTAGTLTSITAGTGLTGGTITNSGTVALATVGTAGSYSKVTTDAYGRVISGANLTDADMPSITSPGRVSGSAINAGTIGGSAAISTSGNIATTGSITANTASANTMSTQALRIFNSSNSNKITLTVPSNLGSDFAWTLPSTNGTAGQVLSTNGSGTLSWSSPSSLAITSITGTAPIGIGGTALSPVISVATATAVSSGIVQLALDGGTSAGTVVQANDSRLTNHRTPSGAAGGDLSANYPDPKVVKIQGVAVSATTPLVGQYHRYSGGTLTPAYIHFTDLKTSAGLRQFPSNCLSSETLVYSSVSDTFSCVTISVSAGNIAGLGSAATKDVPSSGDAGTSELVMGSDSRLTNSRAPTGSAGGDLSGSFPNPAVSKMQGVSYSALTPFSGQVYRFNGSVMTPSFMSIADLKSAAGLMQIPNNCTASQTMIYNSTTDTFNCVTVAISVANIPGLGTGANLNAPASGDASATEVVLGSDTRLTNSRTPTGSAGGDLTGTFPNPTLTTTGVSSGTYSKVTVDTKGRVLNGGSLSLSDIPDLSWAKITSGVPSSLAGFGITDATKNAGDVPSFQSGTDATKPVAGTTGRIYFATDTQRIYRDNGSAWALLASAAGSGGTVTSVTAGTGLTGGTVTSTGTLNVDVGTTANKIVQLDANGKLPALDGSQLSNLPPFGNMQVFDSSGTFTPPAGVKKVYVQVWGAGGGGSGGCTGLLILGGWGGNGGGGGGYGAGIYTLTNSSAVTVTVGTGGTRGLINAVGTKGGDSSFGGYVSSVGGDGGVPNVGVPAAGGSSTGALSTPGGYGIPASYYHGGAGGVSSGGFSSPGSALSSAHAVAANCAGCGGGGGFGLGGAGSQGGNGANGRVVVWY